MSKPDDVPQDVWDRAAGVVGPPDGLGYAKLQTERVARALMADRDQQRAIVAGLICQLLAGKSGEAR